MPSLDDYLKATVQPDTLQFLRAIAWSEDDYAIADGDEVWVDHHRFPASVVTDALRHCAISDITFGGETVKTYALNGIGLALLARLMPAKGE